MSNATIRIGGKDKRMAGIGDKVTVRIEGPTVLSGTATASGSTAIGEGFKIEARGTIIGESEKNWLVELERPLYGNIQIALPKDKVK